MSLIDALGKERAKSLRQMAAIVGANDDTAVWAWTAWQSIVSLTPEERARAISLILGMEEIKRKVEGREPMFTVGKTRVVERVR